MTFPLTPWYPASVKPVHSGSYLAMADESTPILVEFDHGEWWYWWPRGTEQPRVTHWRGLAFDPASATENPNIVVSRDGFFDARFPLCGWWVPKP